MNAHALLTTVALVFIAVPGASSCTKKKKTETAAPAPLAKPVETLDIERPDEVMPDTPPKQLARVHFDFDRADLREDARRTLAQNAEILLAAPSVEVRVEGHCDELGSTQYNLALGERRADAVRRHLVLLGIDDSRISTVSFGEERPLEPGLDEDVRARNRRAELIVIGDGDELVTSSTQPSG